jgi:RNA polymerase sigma factor (sigma-70 family)
VGAIDLAEAIAQGDLDAVGTAFDEHGQELYDYCQSQLGDVTDAAEVVEATFVVAAAKASLLPNPERLRAWLFAIARCACHQQLQAEVKPAYLEDMTAMSDCEQLADGSAWQADLLSSAWKALAAMNPAEREIVELNLRHRLDTEELADILGVTRSRARTLVQSSCAQFEASEDLLLAACPEQAWTCDAAAGHLNSMNGDLSKISPRWMKGHAAHCPICAKRRRRSPDPAVLIALLPSAAMPANERQRLLWLLSDDSSDTADYRAEVAERVEPFGDNGFPGKAAPQVNRRRRSSYALAACAAAVAIALLGAGAVLVDDHTSNQNAPSSSAANPASSGSTKSDGTHSSGDRKSSKRSVVTRANAGANNGGASSPQPGKAGSSPRPTTSKSPSPKPITSKSSAPKPTTSPSSSSSPPPSPPPPPPTSPPPSPSPSPTASASADSISSPSSSDASLFFGALFGGL